MRKLKTYTLSVAALGGLFLIGSVMRSRDSQAKGAYSTPVTVMNTSSAPAIHSSIDDPGRIPYSSLQQALLSSPATSQFFNFPPVPANHRLVITQISGAFNTTNVGVPVMVELTTQGGTFGVTLTPPVVPLGENSFTAPLIYYFDAGQTPEVWAGAAAFSGGQSVRLTGYLLDCSAAPCAAVAQ